MPKTPQEPIDTTIYFNHRQPWTAEEDDRFIALSRQYPDKELALLLGRTMSSLWQRRLVLQVTKPYIGRQKASQTQTERGGQ